MQKKRTTDVLPIPDKLIRYRQLFKFEQGSSATTRHRRRTDRPQRRLDRARSEPTRRFLFGRAFRNDVADRAPESRGLSEGGEGSAPPSLAPLRCR